MYTYIAQYYAVEERNIGINDKKVGRTRDLSAREIALNNTKGPIRVFFRKAWNTGDDTAKVEKSLHAILDNDNSDGEWFKDADETLVERVSNFMSNWGYEEKSLETTFSEEDIKNDNYLVNDKIKIVDSVETDSNRKNLHLIVGETFSSSRYGVENSITIVQNDHDGSIGYKSSLNNKIYNSGGKAWQNPLKEYGNKNNRDMGLCTINWWVHPKNSNGENPDQVITRKLK